MWCHKFTAMDQVTSLLARTGHLNVEVSMTCVDFQLQAPKNSEHQELSMASLFTMLDHDNDLYTISISSSSVSFARDFNQGGVIICLSWTFQQYFLNGARTCSREYLSLSLRWWSFLGKIKMAACSLQVENPFQTCQHEQDSATTKKWTLRGSHKNDIRMPKYGRHFGNRLLWVPAGSYLHIIWDMDVNNYLSKLLWRCSSEGKETEKLIS